MSDDHLLVDLRERYADVASLCDDLARNRLKDALFSAGRQWGVAPTPDEILSAIDVAGFDIVSKDLGIHCAVRDI